MGIIENENSGTSSQIIDMGSFDLNLTDQNNKQNSGATATSKFGNFKKQGWEKGQEPYNDPFVKQAYKETAGKIQKKKTPEEIQKHQELVLILSRYGQSRRFSEFLKSMNFNLSVTHLKGCSLDDLEEIHKREKISIDNKNVSNFWQEMAFGTIQTGEAICVNTKLGQKVKIQGLTELLRNDETFLDLIEQIELENQNITHTSPYIRLVYSILSSSMKIHSVNTMLEKRLSIIKSQSTEENKEGAERPAESEKSEESEEKVEESQEESQEEYQQDTNQPEILSFE